MSGWRRCVIVVPLLAVISGACRGDSVTAPSPIPAPAPDPTPPGPAILLRITEVNGFRREGTLYNPPSVSYSTCGEMANVSGRTATYLIEMSVFGPDGQAYVTEPAGRAAVPQRVAAGGGWLGCGGTSVSDYDLSHRLAVRYRVRLHYTLDNLSGGTIELEGSIQPPSEPEVTGVVINEFRSRGPRGNRDQFIELRNVTSAPIRMDDWFVQVSTRSYEVGPTARLGASVTINPGCYFLLTTATVGTYSGTAAGDLIVLPILRDAGGLALRSRSGQVVDQVAMGSNTVYKEGTPLDPFGAADTDRSYVRVGPDTDDNSRDFRMGSPSTPQNSASCR